MATNDTIKTILDNCNFKKIRPLVDEITWGENALRLSKNSLERAEKASAVLANSDSHGDADKAVAFMILVTLASEIEKQAERYIAYAERLKTFAAVLREEYKNVIKADLAKEGDKTDGE